MFGTDDQTQASNDDPAMLDNVKQLASQPADTVVPSQPLPATPDPAATPPDHPAEPAAGFSSSPVPEPATPDVPATPALASPAPPSPSPTITSTSAPADTSSPFAANGGTSSDTSSAPANDNTTSTPDPTHLAGLKKDALDHLDPLADHIDGDTPEETFKRTMMMIQANDNHGLLEKALAAAKKIEDDKARAQALLDIINEINYFSSQNISGDSPAA